MTILNSVDLTSLVDWSRAQFAMTAMYHWLFVPLTLGLSFIIAIMVTKYNRTGDEFWKRTAKFWMRLFGINFAVGVATGLILEFEFGTNWSNYSYFVGDIFGAPLAIEGIMAFFMEATFIAVMFFGWERVSPRFHLISTWLTAIGASISAVWILVANAWMQLPVGMEFNIETARNEMVSFSEVLFSPMAINKFLHTTTSSFVLGSIFVIGISAWFLLKKRETRFARESMKIAAIFGIVCAVLTVVTGDTSSRLIAKAQPMKFAAMEGLYDGGDGVEMVAIGVARSDKRVKNGEEPFACAIRIPKALSLLTHYDANAYIPGMNDLINGDPERGLMPAQEKIDRGRVAIEQLGIYREARNSGDTETVEIIKGLFSSDTPEGREFLSEYYKYFGYGYLASPDALRLNTPLLFYCYRFMVGTGFLFLALFILVLVLLKREDKGRRRGWYHVMLWSIPLVYISSQAGWAVAEVGRQPWTIQDLMPTVAAVSNVSTGSVKLTFFIFLVLFAIMLIAEVMIMVKQIQIGPKSEKPRTVASEAVKTNKKKK